jgi:hypothetical protein
MLTSMDIFCDDEGKALNECELQQSVTAVDACVACVQAVPPLPSCDESGPTCTALQDCEHDECIACSQELGNYMNCLLADNCGAGCGSSQGSSVSWI